MKVITIGWVNHQCSEPCPSWEQQQCRTGEQLLSSAVIAAATVTTAIAAPTAATNAAAVVAAAVVTPDAVAAVAARCRTRQCSCSRYHDTAPPWRRDSRDAVSCRGDSDLDTRPMPFAMGGLATAGDADDGPTGGRLDGSTAVSQAAAVADGGRSVSHECRRAWLAVARLAGVKSSRGSKNCDICSACRVSNLSFLNSETTLHALVCAHKNNVQPCSETMNPLDLLGGFGMMRLTPVKSGLQGVLPGVNGS